MRRTANTVTSQETCHYLNDYAYTLMGRSSLDTFTPSSIASVESRVDVCHFFFAFSVEAYPSAYKDQVQSITKTKQK
jgi:hypothetical protein